MATIKEKIDAGIKEAMLARNNTKKEVLKVVKSEISREEAGIKVYGDVEVIQLIRKTIKNLETIGTDQSREEIVILDTFVPSKMSEENIKEAVSELITEFGAAGNKSMMGKVMQAFNAKYAGQADGKIVSKIVSESL
jgi:hypothetical protein